MKSRSLFATRSISLLLLIGTAALSCKKDNDSEQEKTGFGNISYFANTSNSNVRKLSSNGIKTGVLSVVDTTTTVNVAWSSATVYVEKISFVGKSNSLLDTTITVEKNLNIFSQDALAGVFKLPSGSYKDVAVKLQCRKSLIPGLAFNYYAFYFKGTFKNIYGGIDSVIVGSSLPFEANLSVNEIVIDPSDNYKATFSFDLNKVLTGISAGQMEAAKSNYKDGKKTFYIFKGGSADEPFYDQVIRNWQSVASVVVTKE
ncbi:hypothetical protein FBD94_20335 [Pedobacter hiemivivus]|uniref:DUF4382 domain-containing protein n=1 Tax=Pedobacter hiemivivus TaxID=2530454 RepID=A0A4U1G257_9SPHI|nr:hypothetical protein [Pedobacter hiemivivus]TKC57627.1 hypothetical protein FBD94_20335 [Pedobacter hiemivivus]